MTKKNLSQLTIVIVLLCSLFHSCSDEQLYNDYTRAKKIQSEQIDDADFLIELGTPLATHDELQMYANLDCYAELGKSLPEATGGMYKIKFITNPINWIKEKHEPVVVEGIRGHAHYWGAIGYAYNEGCFFAKTHKRIFVIDNGAYSKEHHYYPYWSCLGGLNYAWKKNY